MLGTSGAADEAQLMRYLRHLTHGSAVACRVLAVAAGAAFAVGSVPPSAATTQFTLTVSKTGSGHGTVHGSDTGGINCGAGCSHSYASGTQVTLSANPDSNSTFAGWSGCSSTSGATCHVTMDQARHVTAKFTAHYKLTVSKFGSGHGTVTSSPGGINCGSTCS